MSAGGSAPAANREPLHQRIRAEIERNIRSGTWPPGHRVPSEHALMTRYGCSRMTVSKTLSALAEAGLVVRRRRAGTIVSHPRAERTLMEIGDFATEAAARGEPYTFEVKARSLDELAGEEAGQLDLAIGAEVLRLECLHLTGRLPLALEKRVIVLASVPQARDEHFDQLSPGSWLLKAAPWTEAEHRISAASADARTARLLRMPIGAACLNLHRRTWQDGVLVTAVDLVHPGDRYSFVGRFSPFGGAGS